MPSSTFVTDADCEGAEACEFKVHTALSAFAVTFALPVTVMPSPARVAKPLPTFAKPAPIADARIAVAAMIVTNNLRSVFMAPSYTLILKLKCLLCSEDENLLRTSQL